MDDQFRLYLDMLQTLERLQAPYVIIGASAGTSYGVTRTTLDADIVVDLNATHIQALAAAYPPPRFYGDPFQMRDSIRLGILFNIIDTTAGHKPGLYRPMGTQARKRRGAVVAELETTSCPDDQSPLTVTR